MTVTIFVVALLAAMAIGMPIAYSLLVCGVALMGWLAFTGVLPAFDSQIIAQRFVDGADNFPLLAVPFFLLAGEFMNAGGLSRRIVDMAVAWVGHFRGGLGYVAVVAAIIRFTSRMSRKLTTSGCWWPGTGTMKGLDPVASTRRS